MLTVKEVLLKAADIIQTNGLAKEILRDSNGAYCTRGAIFEAAGISSGGGNWTLSDLAIDADETLARYLVKSGAVPSTSTTYPIGGGVTVVRWNNQPARTQEEAINALRKAASELV
jgi:hypothetical protein